MAAFETGINETFPDVGQVLHLSTEHVDPLPAGDLGVEFVLLRRFADSQQLVGRDLAAGDSRNDRVRPAALHVGQKAVVGVLQRLVRVFQDVVIPERRQD